MIYFAGEMGGGEGGSKRLTLNQLTLQGFEFYANAHSIWDHASTFAPMSLFPSSSTIMQCKYQSTNYMVKEGNNSQISSKIPPLY